MNTLTNHHLLIAVIASVLTACVGDELGTGMTGAAVTESSEDEITTGINSPFYASSLITAGAPIQNSASDYHWIFGNASIYAPLGGGQRALISSDPSGTGPIVVDNGLYVNGREVDGLFAGVFNDPRAHLGENPLNSYYSVEAIDVTQDARTDGWWHIRLFDYGYTFASTRLYLVIQ